MEFLVIPTQRRETESEPPRRQDRPEDLEAADVHVSHIRCIAIRPMIRADGQPQAKAR